MYLLLDTSLQKKTVIMSATECKFVMQTVGLCDIVYDTCAAQTVRYRPTPINCLVYRKNDCSLHAKITRLVKFTGIGIGQLLRLCIYAANFMLDQPLR